MAQGQLNIQRDPYLSLKTQVSSSQSEALELKRDGEDIFNHSIYREKTFSSNRIGQNKQTSKRRQEKNWQNSKYFMKEGIKAANKLVKMTRKIHTKTIEMLVHPYRQGGA